MNLLRNKMHLILPVLLAAPLTSQQTVVVPDVSVVVEPPAITNEITVEVQGPDSAQLAAGLRAQEAIAAYFEECGCTQQSTSRVVRVGQSALIAILGFAAWQLKKIADKPSGDDIHNDGDTNVDVTVPGHPDHPPHPEPPPHNHHDDDYDGENKE